MRKRTRNRMRSEGLARLEWEAARIDALRPEEFQAEFQRMVTENPVMAWMVEYFAARLAPDPDDESTDDQAG